MMISLKMHVVKNIFGILSGVVAIFPTGKCMAKSQISLSK